MPKRTGGGGCSRDISVRAGGVVVLKVEQATGDRRTANGDLRPATEDERQTTDDGKVFSFESYYFNVVVILLSTR